MRITKRVIYILLALALIAAIVFRLKSNKDTARERVYIYDKEQPVWAQTLTLTAQSVEAEISFAGAFEPVRESRISAEIQGKINAIYVDAGSIVKKGQILIQLDQALLRRQLEAMDVQIQNLMAEYEVQLQANNIQIDGLQADVDRYRVLAAADAIQGIQLEKAELLLKTSLNQRQSILQQSALKNAQAQRALVQEQINKTAITAPFDGIVTAKLSEAGAFAAPGVPLLQITDIYNLKFIAQVPEADLGMFPPKQAYRVAADVFPDNPFPAVLTMVGSKANPGNSFPVQFAVKNSSDLKIKAGMFGKVAAQIAQDEKGLVIPAAAMFGTAVQPQVYRIHNGKAVLQNIEIGRRIKDKVVVIKGLQEGDVVAISGLINLFDGANVKISE